MGKRTTAFDAAMPHIRALRNEGYAVIIWSPGELDGAKPSKVEDRCIELGWDVIEALRTESYLSDYLTD